MIYSLLTLFFLYTPVDPYYIINDDPNKVLACLNEVRQTPLVVHPTLQRMARWINTANMVNQKCDDIDLNNDNLEDRFKHMGMDSRRFKGREFYSFYVYSTRQDWLDLGQTPDLQSATYVGIDIQKGSDGLFYCCVACLSINDKYKGLI